MPDTQIAYTVALGIGAGVVAWCCGMIVNILQRLTAVETKQGKCHCRADSEGES